MVQVMVRPVSTMLRTTRITTAAALASRPDRTHCHLTSASRMHHHLISAPRMHHHLISCPIHTIDLSSAWDICSPHQYPRCNETSSLFFAACSSS